MATCSVTKHQTKRRNGSRKKQGKTTYRAEFTLHPSLVKPFLTKGNEVQQIQKLTSTTFSIHPKTTKQDTHSEWRFVVSGRNKKNVERAWDMYAQRHNKVLKIIRGIVKAMKEKSDD
jgi:hypothetical protein